MIFEMTFLLCGLWAILQLYIAHVLLTCESGSNQIFTVTKMALSAPMCSERVAPDGRKNWDLIQALPAHKQQLCLANIPLGKREKRKIN